MKPGNGLTTFNAPPADPTPAPTAQPANKPSTPIASPTPTPSNPEPSPSPNPDHSTAPDPTPSESPDPPPNSGPSPNTDPTKSPDPSLSPDPITSLNPQANPPANDPSPQNPSESSNPAPEEGSSTQQSPSYSSQNFIPTAADPVAPNDPTSQGYANPGPSPSTTPIVPIIIGTQTITPGSAAVIIDGKTYSIDPSSSALIINGVVTQLPDPIAPSDSKTYLLDSQTLVAGGAAITVSSLLVSLISGGQSVVMGGTTTEAFAQVFTSAELVLPTASTGLGGVIVSLGGFADPSSPGHSGPQVTAIGNGTGFDGVTVSGLGTRTKGAAHLYMWIGGVCVMVIAVTVL